MAQGRHKNCRNAEILKDISKIRLLYETNVINDVTNVIHKVTNDILQNYTDMV